MIRSIADLFHPHDPALVEAAMRDRQRLHLKTDRAAAFARLLPWELFNTLPTADMLLNAEMRVIQRGRDAPFDMLAPRPRTDGERKLSPEALHALCEQGMSLVLNRIGRQVPRIAALVAMVERHFQANSSVNAYASFRRDGAFQPHFDAHDVLVLQVQGSKRWFLHGQPHRFPLDRGRFPVGDDPGPVEMEALMEPGNILFLPRGEVHWAETASEASLHLTIRIRAPRASDLLPWLAALAEREETAREDISPLEAGAAREARIARLRAMLHEAADGLDLEAFERQVDRDAKPMPVFNLGLMQELPPGTWIQPALRRRVPLGERGALIGGRRVALTPGERTVLAQALAEDSVQVSAISGLPQDAAREAVAGLARKGLIFLFQEIP